MSKIIISPYSRILKNRNKNPKDYPYFEEFISLIQQHGEHEIIQIGVTGEKKLVDNCLFDLKLPIIEFMVRSCDFFISVDSFLPHLANYIGKSGVVIFSQSDPEIFGYKENTNILKDRKYLRENQFLTWEQSSYDKNAFVSPEIVFEQIKNKYL